MLKFRIGADSAGAANNHRLNGSTKETWRDAAGQVVASVWSSAGYYRFEIPDTAVFLCNIDDGTVLAIPLGSASATNVRDIYYRSILPFLLHGLGYEGLHAAAIAVDGRVYAFCAPSGTGKSTLIDGFRQRGYAVWTDDCLVLRQTIEGMVTLPVPFHIRLAKSGPTWTSNSGLLVDTTTPEVFDPDNALTLRMGALFMVVRRAGLGGQPRREALPPADSIRQLLTHAYAFSTGTPERRRQLMDHFLTVAATVPSYRLELPDDAGQIENVLDFLEPLLASGHGRQDSDPLLQHVTPVTTRRDLW